MEQPPESSTASVLGIVSILCGVLGWAAYCVGAFLCLGWVGGALWVVGLVLGFVGMLLARRGGSRAAGCAGLTLNLLSLIAIVALTIFGVGLYAMLLAIDQSVQNNQF